MLSRRSHPGALGVAVFQHSLLGGSRTPPPTYVASSPLLSLFSQQKNQLPTHLTGAFFAFFVGNLYFWMQHLLFWWMKSLPQPGPPWIGPLRLGLCSLCTILMVTSILTGGGGRAWGLSIGLGVRRVVHSALSCLGLRLLRSFYLMFVYF